MKVYKKIFNKHSNFILISYFWGSDNINKGSLYQLSYGEQVARIIKDCTKLRINYYFVEYPKFSKLSYQEALSYKPVFIKKTLDKFKDKSCIFLDTDFRILKYPHLFEQDADLWFFNWNFFNMSCFTPYQVLLAGGILGFGNTETSRKILDILINNFNKHHSEDITFSGLLTRNFLTVHARCVWLPSTYLYMFQNHVYEPGLGYTKIVNYSQELKHSFYKKSDLVIVHEDFETGLLDDIYKEKISRNRYPPKTFKYLGEKLRCLQKSTKFIYYKDWGMTSSIFNQSKIDILDNPRFIIKKIPKLKSKTQTNYYIIHKNITNKKSKFIILTTDTYNLNNFSNVNYIITKSLTPIIIYNIMKLYSKYNILVLNNFKLKKYPKILDTNPEIDFMCFNNNNNGSCNDPRILNLINENCLYFSNNQLILDFLLIWDSLGNLEYAFNKSLAINKLRCYWLSNRDISTFVKIDYTPIKYTHSKFRKNLEQCGIKPKLDPYTQPLHSHYSGSTSSKIERPKYSKKFLNTTLR